MRASTGHHHTLLLIRMWLAQSGSLMHSRRETSGITLAYIIRELGVHFFFHLLLLLYLIIWFLLIINFIWSILIITNHFCRLLALIKLFSIFWLDLWIWALYVRCSILPSLFSILWLRHHFAWVMPIFIFWITRFYLVIRCSSHWVLWISTIFQFQTNIPFSFFISRLITMIHWAAVSLIFIKKLLLLSLLTDRVIMIVVRY